MPEEINRLVTDSIADLFFVTEPSGIAHLKREGKQDTAIYHVGHVMVDNLLYQVKKLERADAAAFDPTGFKEINTGNSRRYGVVTLHRPSNVDTASTMVQICNGLREISAELPLIFPVHPRTQGNLEKFGIDLGPNVTLVGPRPTWLF